MHIWQIKAGEKVKHKKLKNVRYPGMNHAASYLKSDSLEQNIEVGAGY